MARHSSTSSLFRDAFLAIFLVGAFIGGTFLAPSERPIVSVPVPKRVSEVRLSGPLTLTHMDRSVLGAETIDPVDFVNEINKERKKIGSPELRINPTLMRAARLRVEVMKKYQNFSHQDPHEHVELSTVLPKLNYHFSWATENIGMGGLSAANFVVGFMNSTSHRTNLLDPALVDTGAAFADGPYKQYYVNYAVQLFAIPSGITEYLGYSDEDRKVYEAALSAVNSSLHPLIRLVRFVRKDTTHTAKHYQKLLRQKEILESVLPKMKHADPLTSRDVTMIIEYNSLL